MLEGLAVGVDAEVSDPQIAGETFGCPHGDADLGVEMSSATVGVRGGSIDEGAGGAVRLLLRQGVTDAVAANVAVHAR